MENLLSEGAIKNRDEAQKANDKNWLTSEIDIGLVVADNDDDAERQKEQYIQLGKRFLNSNLANTAARHMNCQTYYITAIYGKPETIRVGDICADYTPISTLAPSAAAN